MATYRDVCMSLYNLLCANADELQVSRESIIIGHKGTMPQRAPFIIAFPTTEKRQPPEQGSGQATLAFDVFVGLPGTNDILEDMCRCVELAGSVAALVAQNLAGRCVVGQPPTFDAVYSGYACAYFAFTTPITWIP